MKSIQMTIAAGILLVAVSGCSSMNSGVSCDQRFHNCLRAQHAWNHWSWCYDELDHPRDFAKGFKAGYKDILNGGKGCQPTLPPKCYWKSKYRSAEGRRRVNSWFDGFSHGALAAQKDGAGSWSQIPLSPTARMNFDATSRRHQPVPDYSQPPAPINAPAPPETPEVGPLLPGNGADAGEVSSDPGTKAPPLPYDIKAY